MGFVIEIFLNFMFVCEGSVNIISIEVVELRD